MFSVKNQLNEIQKAYINIYCNESAINGVEKYGIDTAEIIPQNEAPQTAKDLTYEMHYLWKCYFDMPNGEIVCVNKYHAGEFMRKFPGAKWYQTPEIKAEIKRKEDEKAAKKVEDLRIINEKKKLDSDYFTALKNNDLTTAQKIIEKAAEISGYTSSNEWRMQHSAPNSNVYDDGSGDERLSDIILDENDMIVSSTRGTIPKDYFKNFSNYYQMDGDYEAASIIKSAIRRNSSIRKKYGDNAHITGIYVYRGVDKSKNRYEGSMRNGDWVTPLYQYAKQNAEDSSNEKPRIIKMYAPLNHLWWDVNSIQELGYDDGKQYAYKDVRNNRKSLDTVVTDANGKIIPPSKRFNYHKTSTEY